MMTEIGAKQKTDVHNLLLLSLVFLICFTCFLRTICPTVYWLDSAELQAALPEFGIPHSPSFPSYMMITHPIVYFPFGDIAFRANCANAVTGAGLGILIAYFCFLLFKPKNTTGRWICAITGLAAVLNPLVWFQNLKAEIYSLNMMFLIGVIIAGLYIIDNYKDQRILFRSMSMMALLLGLGITNHSLLTAHIFPAAGLLIVFYLPKFRFREIVFFALIFILTSSIYLYLPIRSSINPWMDTGNPENSINFINAVTRRGTYNRFFGNYFGEWIINFSAYFTLIRNHLSGWVLFLSGIGLAVVIRNNWKKGIFICLAAGSNIAVTLMNRNFNANPDTGPAYLMLSSIILIIGLGSLFSFLNVKLTHRETCRYLSAFPVIFMI
ncbi:DUF2723 domain-containing protein [bacterium]|nr:DUF2723 domain-containing protein [bacterium]